MSKISLYEIANEFMALEEMLFNDEGELSAEHEALKEYAQNLLISKTDNYISFIRKMEDEILLAEMHVKRINAYKEARENAIDRLKAFAGLCLKRMKVDKITGEMGSISIRKPSKVLRIDDADKIPEEFCSYSRIIDNAKVKSAIVDGEEISGASLVDGKKSILIKSRGVK